MDETREKVIKGLGCCSVGADREPTWNNLTARNCGKCPYNKTGLVCTRVLSYDALSLLKAQEPQWRPFVKRALTEEEQKHHPDWCYILDGEVPEDEEEILVYRPWNNKAGYIIEMDTYCNNGDEVYLDGAGDIENGMYWMPLPEQPKEE